MWIPISLAMRRCDATGLSRGASRLLLPHEPRRCEGAVKRSGIQLDW